MFFLNACAIKEQKQAEAFTKGLCADTGIRVYESAVLPPGLKLYVTESYTAYEPYRIYTPIRAKAANTTGSAYQFRPVTRTRKIINPSVFNPSAGEKALGPDYQVNKLSEQIFPQSQALADSFEFWRIHYKIVRKSDGRVLGELIAVEGRGGGFLPRLWGKKGAGYRCPEHLGLEDLAGRIFVER